MPGGEDRRLARQRALYRAMLVFYPRSFRKEYGAAMVQAFGDQAHEPRWSRRGLWIRTIRDLLASAPTIRREEGMFRSTAGIAVGVVLFVTAVAVIAAEGPGISAFIAALIALAVVGAIFAGSAVLSQRNNQPTERAYGGGSVRTWTWWTALAALLAGFELFVGIGQLVDETSAANAGALGFFGTGSVSIVTGLWIRARSHPAGNWLIAVGALPGVVLIWLIVPAIVTVIVMVNAIRENVRLREAPARA